MRSTQRKIGVSEELDRLFGVSFPSGDVDEPELVDQVSHFASHVTLFARAFGVRLQVDFVRVVMTSGAQASAGPVEEVLSRDLNVNVPTVVAAVVLAAVRVEERLDENGRVRKGFVLGLPENDSPGDGICESGNCRYQLLIVEIDVGAEPTFGDRAFVDDDRPADDRGRSEQGQGGIDNVFLEVVPMRQVSVLSAQIAQLVFVKRSFPGLGTRGRIYAGGIEVITGSSARRIGNVESGRNRELVNVKTSGAFTEASQENVGLDRLKRRGLSERYCSFNALMRERSSSHFSFDLTNLGARQKAFRMFLVEENEIEGSVTVQLRQLEVDVSHVDLGEHALFFPDFHFPELPGQIAFSTARPVFF